MGLSWEGREAYWRAVVGAAGPKLLSVAVAGSAEAPGVGTEVEIGSGTLNSNPLLGIFHILLYPHLPISF